MAQRFLQFGTVHFGADPEFFFTDDKGKIVGAERVIPATGLKYNNDGGGSMRKVGAPLPKFALDGVQVELNPNPHYCRANMGNEIKFAFQTLKNHLDGMKGKFKANFSSVVTLRKKELDSLSDACRVFGCAPSFNLYDKTARVHADAARYLRRSGGGHIHLGLGPHFMMQDQVRQELVKVMDLVVGNTCVLIDRDPFAHIRRRNYGRAGEYRLPNHGVEYRTLSNFWLRSYQLFSMVMGLSRLAAAVVYTEHNPHPYLNPRDDYERDYNERVSWPAMRELLSGVEIKDVVRAINQNDPDLAAKNFEFVKKFVAEYLPRQQGTAIWGNSLDLFDHFVKKVQEDGLEYWFPDDPLDHWVNLKEGHGIGFESFLVNDVAKDAQKKASGYTGAQVTAVLRKEGIVG